MNIIGKVAAMMFDTASTAAIGYVVNKIAARNQAAAPVAPKPQGKFPEFTAKVKTAVGQKTVSLAEEYEPIVKEKIQSFLLAMFQETFSIAQNMVHDFIGSLFTGLKAKASSMCTG
jgi:hypothetical protein